MANFTQQDIRDYIMADVDIVGTTRWNNLVSNDSLVEFVGKVWQKSMYNEGDEKPYTEQEVIDNPEYYTDWLIYAHKPQKEVLLSLALTEGSV